MLCVCVCVRVLCRECCLVKRQRSGDATCSSRRRRPRRGMAAAARPTMSMSASCSCTPSASTRIAVNLYGLPRALNLTAPLLQEHVLTPLRSMGCVDVFLAMTRSSALLAGALGLESVTTFLPCRYEIIDQDAARLDGRVLAPFGPDTWSDGHASVSNHLLELYSARALSQLVRAQEASAGLRYTHAAVSRIDTTVSTVDFRLDRLSSSSPSVVGTPTSCSGQIPYVGKRMDRKMTVYGTLRK